MTWVYTLITERSVALRACSERFKSKFPSIMTAIAVSHEISLRGSSSQLGMAAILSISSTVFLSMCLSTEQEVHATAQIQKPNRVLHRATLNGLQKKLQTEEKRSILVPVS